MGWSVASCATLFDYPGYLNISYLASCVEQQTEVLSVGTDCNGGCVIMLLGIYIIVVDQVHFTHASC